MDKEKDAKIAEAVLADAAISEKGTDSLRDDIRYPPNPIRGKNSQLKLNLRETPPPISSPEKENSTIPIIPDSITSVLLKMLTDKHPDINIGSVKRFEEDDVPYLAFGVSNIMVRNIFFNPIVEVLEMKDFDVDRENGYRLEKRGLLDKGITDRSYARYLQKNIEERTQRSWNGHQYNLDDSSDEENKEDEEDGYDQEALDELLEKGIYPLTDEEISQILEGMIENALKNKSSR